MSILSFSNISQSFGALDVFTGLDGSIPNDGKIGLVGPNGIGKTTLLRILAGMEQPTSGTVHLSRGTRLGYLRQEAVQAFEGRGHSVYQEMLTVFTELRAQEARLREMEEAMANPDWSEALFEEYGKAQERFERAGGYEYELRIQQVLDGLGFDRDAWQTPLTHLSGGQMTRALLARLLLEKPDLLVLDEPTNHLDVAAVEWLETTLRQWECALLVVSHDRYFLDNVVNRVWEMGRTHIEVYRGNYSAYVQQRQERWERQQELYEAEMARLEKELDFIRRHIASQNTDIAKGKLKRLTRDVVAIESLGFGGTQGKSWSQISAELESRVRPMSVSEISQRIKSLPPPITRPPQLNIRLETRQRSGDIVLQTEDLRIGYPRNQLFEADDILLHRGECAALIGPNGSGKSTFLRTVLGEHEPLAGEIRLGASLKIGYFAQAHDRLNLDNTVMQELLQYRPTLSETEARTYLAQYLFREDDVWKQVSALSGGERGRLALAILALRGANFLLLDEPTNHLDIPAQEVLQEVLEHFRGTILLVSHDRYLVDHLATQIWELRDSHLHVFPGSYQELLDMRQREKQEAKAAAETQQREQLPSENGSTGLSKGERRRREEQLVSLENQIVNLEESLARWEDALQVANEAQHVEEIQRLSQLYTSAQTELEALMARWSSLAEEIV
ncbi:MAG: ABC-F family ATP-binding cassette domain-containing protein [Chloroflexota bacterium]|nr:ABC-F family ATP-binding cassette domain-containing protein [Chloroflexota bacterium]